MSFRNVTARGFHSGVRYGIVGDGVRGFRGLLYSR